MFQNLLPQDGELYYFPELFNRDESHLYLTTLTHEVAWGQYPIKIFGKDVMQPRLISWYGERTYTYSGLTMYPRPWSESLLRIKQKVEETTGDRFNSVLLNLYRTEKDSMGWHRDNERELGHSPTIASVSFGAVRTFCLKHCQEKDLKLNIDLAEGSLLVMKGESQHHWLHSLPKRTVHHGPRLNLTFRFVYS